MNFKYRNIDSFLHKLDPRSKILATIMFFVYSLTFRNVILQTLVFLMVLFYATLGHSIKSVLSAKTFLFSIFITTILMWLLTLRGPTKIILWFSLEGLLYGLSTGLALIIMIISSIVFITTTKVEDFTIACMRLGLPYRVAFSISSAIRMIPTIAGTGTVIIQAQMSRGLDIDSGNFMQKLKKYIPVIIPTILSVIRGTNVFVMALESKGFGYSDKRVNYTKISYCSLDYIFSLIILFFIGIAIFLKLYFKL